MRLAGNVGRSRSTAIIAGFSVRFGYSVFRSVSELISL